MEATTYRKLAEMTRVEYYKIQPSDDASLSIRFFAEQVAQEVAVCAWESAIENSNQGEGTYAGGQFISTFKNIPIVLEDDGTKSSTLPSTPAGLPNNQEIASVKITGSKCLDCIPMSNNQAFSQQLIGLPCNMVFYKLEGGNIVYETSNALFEGGTATIKMVGAVSGEDLLSSDLTIPKNYESRIMTRILGRLLPLKQLPIDYVNDAISNPG